MTVKEIAKSVGKTERSVHNWVKNASEKNAQVCEKIAEARATSKPADYTFDETCFIIECGMGESAAGVYRASASEKTTELPNGSQLEALRKIYGDEAKSVVSFLIGYKADSQDLTYPVAHNLGRISKQAYAVEMQQRRKQEERELKRYEPTLFDDDPVKTLSDWLKEKN